MTCASPLDGFHSRVICNHRVIVGGCCKIISQCAALTIVAIDHRSHLPTSAKTLRHKLKIVYAEGSSFVSSKAE